MQKSFFSIEINILRNIVILFMLFTTSVNISCSNSENINNPNENEFATSKEYWNSKVDYLPLNDSEYPYAGIPRLVIKTNNLQTINDRDTKIPAKMQLWGESSPTSEVIDLTIKGRGNSSWLYMPKKSYKIELSSKNNLLGMPKDRDWALISNYADKTLMKNYLMYHLSSKLGAFYSPRCEFVELFLNNEYLGVYLLTETIKVGINRVNIPKNNASYIIEKTESYQEKDQLIYPKSTNGSDSTRFKVHYPKNASKEALSTIKNHIEFFEEYLTKNKFGQDCHIDQWININEYTKYYWVQELSKNPDAATYSSIFFSWKKGGTITMGPVWDFDLAFGGYNKETISQSSEWLIKKGYWHHSILKDTIVARARINFWKDNKQIFFETINTADSIFSILNKAASNNFRKWNVLQSTKYIYHRHSYKSYKDAVDDLKSWIQNRLEWIDRELQ